MLRHNITSYFKDYRLLFFFSAVFLYGVFSSPTPDNPGIIEGIILFLFLAALGVKGVYQPVFDISLFKQSPKWEITAFILFLYGLSVPVLSALYHDVKISIFLRDIIGFIFLCLPFFVVPFILENKKRQIIFFVSVLFVGLAFSIRVLFLDFSFFVQREELLYLANSPLVLLSALYFGMTALSKMKSLLTLQHFIIVVVCLFISILPLAAMYIDFQRASFAALGLSIFIVLGHSFVKAPFNIVMPIIILSFIGILFGTQVVGIVENILVKTSQVGLNMRVQEFWAVWSAVSSNVWALFFGQGWGASFASPAVGDLNVSYTHSLITYMLLKTGLIGLGLTLIYLFFIFEKLIRLVFIEPVRGSALIWPFIIPIFLYASYKSLDYGFILALILVIDTQARTKFK